MPGPATEQEILTGGRPVTVTRMLLDSEGKPTMEGDKLSTVEQIVTVKLVTGVRDMPKLGMVWADDIPLIAFVTSNTQAWAEALTMDSQLAVLEEGRDLNFPAFARWFKGQTKSLDALGQTPLVKQAIADAIRELDRNRQNQAKS